MKRLIIILILFISATPKLFADKIVFSASAPDAVVVGEQFRLSYTVNRQNVKDFRIPAIKGFDVLMGPSRSQQSNTQIINGNVSSSSSITYTYILMANSPGNFSLPSAAIIADGSQLSSNSLKIKVLPPDQNAQAQNGSSSRATSNRSSGVSNQDLFILASVSKSSVYEQEAFVLTYKIYTKEANLGMNNVKLPDFKGFHSQEIELPTNARFMQEHYKGRNYLTTIYRQFVLFPQQKGKLYIDPAQFDMTVGKTIESSDPFDAFFNGGSNVIQVNKMIRTPRMAIDVKPLPANKPANYSGGVGEFAVSSSISSQKIKTNDAVTLKIVISGTGNLKLISAPTVDFSNDFEVYDPKTDNKTLLTKNGVSGNKVIEYLAIARHAGKYKIPGISFSYFDIQSKSYKTIKTEDYEIVVEKGAGNASQVVSNFTNQEELKVLGEDIRFIKKGEITELASRTDMFYDSTLYWMFYIIPILSLITLLIIYRKKAKENSNVAKMRNKKANKVASKRMKLASKLLDNHQKDAFYDEVLKALWGYISDKLSIPVSQLSKENIEDNLRNKGVNQDLITEFISTLDSCEFARFAPGDENQAMDQVFKSSIELISKMENSIK